LQALFRKNIFTIVLTGLICVLLFVPNAKAYFLQGLLRTGLFNASIKKENHIGTPLVTGLLFADSNGHRINTADLKGKVIFISFWATWCPPCIAEMGSVHALYNKLKTDNRFVFILADADNNLPVSAAFMRNHHYTLPVYQSAAAIAGDLFNGTLPTTLIINSKGELVYKHEGIANYNTEEIITMMRSL